MTNGVDNGCYATNNDLGGTPIVDFAARHLSGFAHYLFDYRCHSWG